ncbi:MAG: ferrous iron transporter B [Candidatus Dadabacteria bacterium]|nr:ferrous iron transporter B [Candidatus Dadabacteria bacterium]
MGRAERSIENIGKTYVVVGRESVGKSQLIASLTGKPASSSNFRGTTVSIDKYTLGNTAFLDTPGIMRDSDSIAVRMTLRQLKENDPVILVVQATNMDEDLEELRPIVEGRLGIMIVTFRDKVDGLSNAEAAFGKLRARAGVPVIPVNARNLSAADKSAIDGALLSPGMFAPGNENEKTGLEAPPERGVFEIPVLGQALSLILLFLPAWIAVRNANGLADSFYDPLGRALAPLLGAVNALPGPLAATLGGDYGLFAMSPFLFLYAVPTVIVFSVILAVYKGSGLIDRLTVSLHPLLLPFGISGRDLVRVIMGFGCNVPAVINTRSCSSCSRGACISAISFGSACSYQLPATLAVFGAAGMAYLAPWYLALLAATTLIYLRITVPREARLGTNRLRLTGRVFLQWPRPKDIWRESWYVIKQFFVMALPVFFLICIAAALMQWSGLLGFLSEALAPVMSLFHLPWQAAPALILGSIRKDGIAIGLLNGEMDSLKAPLGGPVEVLTVVYLAGVLLPCLVTSLTVARETSARFALRMMARQAAAASCFALVIAWGGHAVTRLI